MAGAGGTTMGKKHQPKVCPGCGKQFRQLLAHLDTCSAWWKDFEERKRQVLGGEPIKKVTKVEDSEINRP